MPKPDDSQGFVVDYAGPMLEGARNVGVDVSANENATIVSRQLRPNPETGGMRLELHFRRNDDKKPVELRAALKTPDAVSETWSYAFPPG
jgi:glucans biosynthesis protein